MATYLDEIKTYPYKALNLIANSKECVGLLLDKPIATITEDDGDKAWKEFMFDFEYVPETTQTACSYIWATANVPRVENRTVKDMQIIITAVVHKSLMKFAKGTFLGFVGNRRDCLLAEIDKLLNFNGDFGIGQLSFNGVGRGEVLDKFVLREIRYKVPDFNFREV